jgi:hypothetical protein
MWGLRANEIRANIEGFIAHCRYPGGLAHRSWLQHCGNTRREGNTCWTAGDLARTAAGVTFAARPAGRPPRRHGYAICVTGSPVLICGRPKTRGAAFSTTPAIKLPVDDWCSKGRTRQNQHGLWVLSL